MIKIKLFTKRNVGLVLLFLVIFSSAYYFTTPKSKIDNIVASNFDNLKTYRSADIAEFNGTDDSKPIYIALNGLVYDVSTGREFYKSDGPYHYLAGRDSSKELNLVGGGIIKRKYPVIGRFIQE